jgi:dTMP kinase
MTFKSSTYPGLFITFEGIDGAGKSTHIPFFKELLSEHFPTKNIVLTREPGGTELGEQLRSILLNQAMDIRTEALLMFASRQEHLIQVIVPALHRGDVVICDRFTDSSFAYQCGGRGLPVEQLEILETWVQTTDTLDRPFILQPNLSLLFDLSSDIAQQRRSATRNPDKFEELDLDFFNRVRNEYLRRAKLQRARFEIIDSSQNILAIQNQLRKIVAGLE